MFAKVKEAVIISLVVGVFWLLIKLFFNKYPVKGVTDLVNII